MDYRISDIARQSGVTADEVIAYLSTRAERVDGPNSRVAESVARAAVVMLSIKSGAPGRSNIMDYSTTPATTYTWQANPVKRPTNPATLRNVSELEAAFPIAAQHLQMLQALGSQFIYAKVLTATDDKKIGYSLVRFSGAVEAAFGITREVMFFYSPYYDVQIRTFTKAKELLAGHPREATPDLIFFSSPDDRLGIKLEDWSTLGFVAIPLESTLQTEPIELVRLLRDHVYARDLFYETTPVRGDRFFGRRALLQELRDDIDNQRVSGVFGLRKSGKTSVLQQLGELLASPESIPIFVDLEVLPSPPEDPTEAFIRTLAAAVGAAVRKAGFATRTLDKVLDDPRPDVLYAAMSRTLEKLASVNIKIALLLDEIEFLTPTDQIDVAEGSYSGVAQTLGVLRSLVQSTQNFTFILSGLTNEILENGRLYGRPNPLFSWAKARYIGPFARSEADELATAIGARMGIELEEGALAALYDGSGGHAYLYRNLASAVVAELPVVTYRRVMRTSDVLHSLIPWKRSIAGNLDEIFGHLERYYPTEAVLLEILLESPSEFAELAATEDQAVHHLASLGLLSESRGQFQASSILELR